MGCDIHPVIEIYEDGEWEVAQSEDLQSYEDRPDPLGTLGGRNYHRFSLLADVRNHYAEHKVTALFPSRGLPSDPSKGAKHHLEEAWGGDIHSVTYFTLEELIAVDWDSDASKNFEVKIFGDIYQHYLEYKRLPTNWKEDYFGDRTFVEESEMQLLLIGGNGLPTFAPSNYPHLNGKLVKSGPVVSVSCPISYYQIDPWLHDGLIPALQEMGDPDKVRVVIGFDN